VAIVTRQFFIGGMTCVNCQNKIEKSLRGVNGVQAVQVSYAAGRAQVDYDPDVVSFEDIRRIVEQLDYTVQDGEGPDVVSRISLLVIIVSLYVLLQRFGVLNLLVPSQLAESGMGYGMLFVTGLLTSVHCIAMCGGINLAQSIGSTARTPAALYNLGRVLSYTAVGFVLGGAGYLAGGGAGAGMPVLVQGVLKLMAGGVMVIMGLNMLGLFPALRRLSFRLPAIAAGGGRPFAVGLLNGLMPCGPLQSMQILALASGSPLHGALSMLAFSLGTVPLMLGLGAAVSALGKRFAGAVLKVGAVLVVVLGLAMLAQGGSLSGLLLPDRLLILVVGLALAGIVVSMPLPKALHRAAALAASLVLVLAAALGPSAGHPDEGASRAMLSDGVQVVSSTLSPGKYPEISVQAGIPVRWTIFAPEGSINGCNSKMLIRDYGVEHAFQPGENIIEFTPDQAGTVAYSCWMGMISGSIYVTGGTAA
jgi:sulfite exporter TauE/SafE/copper chaperone CopZ